MIFNIAQGGLAYIAVTAPEDAEITATCSGLTVTGSGTCTLEAPVVGTWDITCVYDGTTKTASVNVASFGATYTASFSYTATISVTTFPSATVTATKDGQSDITDTADNSGACSLTVPAGGRGSWTVTADNGSVSESGTVNVAAYDTTYTISLLTSVADISVTVGSETYNYKGAEISNSNVKISPVGLTGWKMWLYTSCTVRFNRLPSNVDICAIGAGGNGASYGGSYEYGYYAGGGGGGGGVVNSTGRTLTTGTDYAVVVGSGASTIASLGISAAKGGNASGRSGGSSGGNSGSGGGGRYINDHTYPATNIGPGNGGGGVYAFGDSGFDGVKYANGGGGGDRTPEERGTVYSSCGSGGAGGCHGTGPTGGINGIVLMRSA